jgi:hypothetical protein
MKKNAKAALVIAFLLEAVSYQMTIRSGFPPQTALNIVINLVIFFWIGEGLAALYYRFRPRGSEPPTNPPPSVIEPEAISKP